MAPRELRKRPLALVAWAKSLVLRLGYRPPYDFAAMLRFLQGRALPGVEVVDDYVRIARVVGTRGTGRNARMAARVFAWPDEKRALKLEVHGIAPLQLQSVVVQRVRRMFDLDADPRAIAYGVVGRSALAAVGAASSRTCACRAGGMALKSRYARSSGNR